MNLDARALLRGVLVGLSMIVPISIVVELLERNIDDLDGSAWMVLPFLLVLAAYVVCGRIAGRAAPAAPLTHGAIAALVSFLGWLVVRVAVPLVQGDDLGFGVKAVVTNGVLAAGFGLFGGALSVRNASV